MEKTKKAKKGKPAKLRNGGAYKRMNFLFQASLFMAKNTHYEDTDKKLITEALSSHYMSMMQSVARRNVLRCAPSIKNVICSKCHALLVPGSSSTVRRTKDVVITTCNGCKTSKRRCAYEKNEGNRTHRKKVRLNKLNNSSADNSNVSTEERTS